MTRISRERLGRLREDGLCRLRKGKSAMALSVDLDENIRHIEYNLPVKESFDLKNMSWEDYQSLIDKG